MTVRIWVGSGGGGRGGFPVAATGTCFALWQDLQYDAWAGVSTGSLTAAMGAQGKTRAEQIELMAIAYRIYRHISGPGDLYRGSRFLPMQLINFLQRGFLFDPEGLRAYLAMYISEARLRHGVPFVCGVTRLEDGEYESVWGVDDDVMDGVLASASMPVYFPPVRMRDGWYVDGGLRNQTPLNEAVQWLREQPDEDKEIHVFLTSPLSLPGEQIDPRNGAQVAGRSLQIALNEVFRTDLDMLRERNYKPGYVPIKATVIAPKDHYGGALDFDPVVIRRMLEDGECIVPERPRLDFTIPGE